LTKGVELEALVRSSQISSWVTTPRQVRLLHAQDFGTMHWDEGVEPLEDVCLERLYASSGAWDLIRAGWEVKGFPLSRREPWWLA